MAEKKQVKCSKCGRKFVMPAHLARHMNTIHGTKAVTAKKKAGATKQAKRRIVKKVVPAKRTTATSRQFAIKGPGNGFAAVRAYRNDLAATRDAMDSRVQAVDQALAALGVGGTTKPKSAARPRRSGPRKGSLKSYIERILRGRVRPLAVKDVTSAVVKAGFKTKNKTLAKSVGIALTGMNNVVRIKRGMYRMK